MGTQYEIFQASVDLTKVESFEAKELLRFLPNLTIEANRFAVFNCQDHVHDVFLRTIHTCIRACGDSFDETTWCGCSEGYLVLQKEGEAQCLEDIVSHLIGKNALSLTYLYSFCSTSDYDEEELPDFDKLAEHVSTLVLQEVLARRLEGPV
jgi:hypothetical protein